VFEIEQYFHEYLAVSRFDISKAFEVLLTKPGTPGGPGVPAII